MRLRKEQQVPLKALLFLTQPHNLPHPSTLTPPAYNLASVSRYLLNPLVLLVKAYAIVPAVICILPENQFSPGDKSGAVSLRSAGR